MSALLFLPGSTGVAAVGAVVGAAVGAAADSKLPNISSVSVLVIRYNSYLKINIINLLDD
jgi:outer membrane lipoprotein SlyB